MSTRIQSILAASLILLLFTTACRTDAPGKLPIPYSGPIFSTDPAKSLTNNSSKTWKPFFYTRNGRVEFIDSCETDDLLTFYVNGDLKYTWGTQHCYLNEPPTEMSNWGFMGTASFIRLGTANFQVYELFDERFVIMWKEISGSDTIERSKHFIPVQ
jgi:hypothetical protein